MAADIDREPADLGAEKIKGRRAKGRFLLPFRRLLGHYIFSSLTRRILVLNLAALCVMVIGILYINQFRDGLVQARIESLMTQGEIIAGAIAASATVETDSITIDPEKLLELQAGESLPPGTSQLENLDFPINPERVAPVLRRLISPTSIRARIYDRDAVLILDSRHLYSRGQILRYNLPAVEEEEPSLLEQVEKFIYSFFVRSDLPLYHEQPGGCGTATEPLCSPRPIRRTSLGGLTCTALTTPGKGVRLPPRRS